ncbi:LuxR family transcriptional regulator [Trebonia kvetii]|uniref:LuxR family transcriptional regulator n=1 Tax=Trebonia kvetii TaxID=2480626 RepID=A0A6P2BKI6_9ACTN|nr:helix-turn-helix transcriptional regulator [Trebonia kvetii]TVY98952.1 LuxR family transcriptional regulator [Trebonia kvetii]
MVLSATAAALLDDGAAAARLYPLFAPLARYYAGDGSGLVFSHGALARLGGEMALTAGRAEDAVAHFRQAITMNSRIGARPFTALSRFGLARALSVGQPPAPAGISEAAEMAARAAEEFRRLDMPGPLARATLLAERLTAARRCASPLTGRETEVAGYVAEGLSNRQIATRLVLSERTVETHVRAILGKLGLRRRTEIAAWALRGHPRSSRSENGQVTGNRSPRRRGLQRMTARGAMRLGIAAAGL